MEKFLNTNSPSDYNVLYDHTGPRSVFFGYVQPSFADFQSAKKWIIYRRSSTLAENSLRSTNRARPSTPSPLRQGSESPCFSPSCRESQENVIA